MASTTATKSAPTSNGAGATNGAGAEDSFAVHRPTDGSVITNLPIDSPQRVAEVAARLRAAQPEWEALGFAGRQEWLFRFRDWMLANTDRVADVMQAETGKVRADAEIEVPVLCDMISFFCKEGPRYLSEETPSPHSMPLKIKRLRVVYRPYPLVGIISPWNFPILLSLGDAVPALVAGASVLIKPSEFTPLAVTELVRAWKEDVGGPDILDVVQGTGETGGALVDESDFLMFTGSERTGKVVMKRAADTLTPVSLELGGKDPMIVMRDADIERAANAAASGGLSNTGQICMSIERVYVEEPVYDEFVDRLTKTVTELRQGTDDRSFKQDLGAMTTPAQTDIVETQVEDARAKGARILTGGRRREGAGDFYEATVVADADHSMTVMTEETFGPVIPVMKVADVDEAVRLSNDTDYGLSGSVMTRDFDRGIEVARRMEVGAVNVDDVLTNYLCLNVPMGGWKNSGVGWRHGGVGIRKYCRSETIVSPRFRQGKRDPLWFPHKRGRRRALTAIYRLLNSRGRGRFGL